MALALHVIGEAVAEGPNTVPAQFRVLVDRRPSFGRWTSEGVVVQVLASARLIEGGVPTEATLAHALSPNMPTTCRSRR